MKISTGRHEPEMGHLVAARIDENTAVGLTRVLEVSQGNGGADRRNPAIVWIVVTMHRARHARALTGQLQRSSELKLLDIRRRYRVRSRQKIRRADEQHRHCGSQPKMRHDILARSWRRIR